MTHRPNTMTHTREYRLLPGVVRYNLLFSVFSRCQTCAPWHKILATPLLTPLVKVAYAMITIGRHDARSTPMGKFAAPQTPSENTQAIGDLKLNEFGLGWSVRSPSAAIKVQIYNVSFKKNKPRALKVVNEFPSHSALKRSMLNSVT